jgi:glycosyltransferase involved in cell wall biosynthesis
MTNAITRRAPVRLHLTNVAGAGASQLLQSLLPALERDPGFVVERIELPDRGKLADYSSNNPATVAEVYRRRLPNALSRILECTLLAGRFDGESPLLVFGDLPLRCRGPQTVFLQQSNLLKPLRSYWRPSSMKYALGRAIFRTNLHRVHAFIVQTDVMRDALERSYPGVGGRVHVIPQPVPTWLLQSGLKRLARVRAPGQALELIYPAAGYPHKNHALLSRLKASAGWPVERLVLTLDAAAHPAPGLSWVQCSGFHSPQAMIAAYSKVDALLFLSKEESFGFPLLEAMFVGLPIVCPDLPYARALCGSQAFYFDADQPESLKHALTSLKTQLDQGWWPDWKSRLRLLPKNWEDVARKFLEIACNVSN